MAATLQQARAALKATIVAYYQGQGEAIQVYDVVPGKVEGPAVVVEPASGSYHYALGSASGSEHTLAIHAMVPLGDRESAQNTLDQMISESGARSIVAAIHSDRRLGSVVAYADPQGYRDYGTRDFGGVNFLMATIDCVVTCHP